jgi:hypothetical protein
VYRHRLTHNLASQPRQIPSLGASANGYQMQARPHLSFKSPGRLNADAISLNLEQLKETAHSAVEEDCARLALRAMAGRWFQDMREVDIYLYKRTKAVGADIEQQLNP